MNRIAVPLVGLLLSAVAPLRAEPPVADRPAPRVPAGSPSATLPPARAGAVDFAKDVQPIFAARCLNCHDAKKHKGGLRLDDAKSARAGGDSGAVILSGPKAAESRLLLLVAGLDPDVKMPPEGQPLSKDEVATLRAWLEQGAKWSVVRGPSSVVRGPTSTHWAFQPVTRIAPPAVKDAGRVRNPIDAFILARLDKEGVAPSPEADRPTLIRRLSLDLLGLPPTPAEVDAFVNDPSPDAYEAVVDRLLASPHYGERWGRHWLDAARYADSDGFEKDTGRPWAWRYRQWVIEALNRDLPYDRFVVEQLAGDLLPNATVEQKMATGFHRNTLTNHEGGTDPEQFRVDQVVDRVNTTAKVFLGVTMGCCQCHDHKYDPFSQREYYQFFAFFNSDREVDIDAPLPGEEEKYQKKAAFDAKKVALALALTDARDRWEADLKLPQLRTLPADVRAALLVEAKERTDAQKKAVAAHFAKAEKAGVTATRAIYQYARQEPTLSKAPTLALGSERKSHVLIRGDFLRPGVAVKPGTPAILPRLTPCGSGAEDEGCSPTRLDLAHWIVDPANPLTGRVLTNWLWQYHFGRGLVSTPEDFGTQGEKPSHPELLDWLATEAVERHWGLKSLHRLIVTSSTYRQSSAARPELRERDPLNVWLARQNRLRLEAEVVRDVSLAASGLLAPTVGGPSVRPPQPPGISDLTYAGSAKWVESTGPDRYRRGLYTWFQRTSPYPMLMTFDAPDSNVCVVRRERSNTPLQALTLLNDTVFVECAQALGQRIMPSPARSASDGIGEAFQQCLGRDPSQAERERLTKLLAEFRELARQQPAESAKLAGKELPAGVDAAEAAAWVALARTLLNLDEFVTRE